ncbi:hypothetical protein N7481_009390 [Penicillium waksmanii]|uniref:uncharacterized protein n=1 Tax=Penicillium waksmanii TaxID=69791 RepID=UPI002547A532|nr:uncharacterized protein N7481_009390 [Penicillium waksmanii]KAJ5975683.1 hypothetical protein N7481_009390 [Penicillium waksmanii]
MNMNMISVGPSAPSAPSAPTPSLVKLALKMAAYLYPIGLGFAKPDTKESACEKRQPGNLPGDGGWWSSPHLWTQWAC